MFTDSVISAGKSLFVICVMIVFFGAFMSSLEYCGAFSFMKDAFSLSENGLVLVKSCLEITSHWAFGKSILSSAIYSRCLLLRRSVCDYTNICTWRGFLLVPFLSHVWHQRFCQPLYAVLSIHSLSPTQFWLLLQIMLNSSKWTILFPRFAWLWWFYY